MSFRSLALILLAVSCTTVFTFGVWGQVRAITVSPAKIEVTVDPGEVYTGKVELYNEQTTQKTFYSSFENFEPRGDSGAPYFIGAKDGLATWLSADASVTIEPGQRLDVPFTIRVPSDAKPGGYFSAVFFGSQPPVSGGGAEVNIGGKIGVLILLRVSGEVEEGGGVLDFSTLEKKWFYTTLPVTFEYRLNNIGGDRVVPAGEIKIKNTFGGSAEILLANENEGSVLPNSTRKFTIVWGEEQEEDTKKVGYFGKAKQQLKQFKIGWYKAKLDVTWGTSGQVQKESVRFFVIPIQLLVVLVIILGALFVLGKTGLRRYNRYIIAQARLQRTHDDA